MVSKVDSECKAMPSAEVESDRDIRVECDGGDNVVIPAPIVLRCGVLADMPFDRGASLHTTVPFSASSVTSYVRIASDADADADADDTLCASTMEVAVEAARVADFLADAMTVDRVCAMLGHQLASDTETPLGDPALGPLPPACLEKVVRYLDRDSAIEFARVWDVCGDMPIHSMQVGGFPVCCRCVRACVRTVSKAAANAMGRIVEEQHATGVVFDLEGQLLDDFLDNVDVDGTHAMQLNDFEGARR